MVNLLMLLNVNVSLISSNSVPARKDGEAGRTQKQDDTKENEPNAEDKTSSSTEGSRIIPKVVNDRLKKWHRK